MGWRYQQLGIKVPFVTSCIPIVNKYNHGIPKKKKKKKKNSQRTIFNMSVTQKGI
jgi:hypothetical protein